MLYLNVKRVMHLRGVENHYEFLRGLGLIKATARKIINDEPVILKLDQFEAICLALNCTPNDILEWKQSALQNVSENHSMNSLKRAGDKDLPTLLNEIPLERFEQIAGILQGLKD
ncbi:MAG TPA: helix-turn-helix transcriptional regulator [Pyrinomonadaceae bacterium]|nr:helix-turn-helix transcriptional regulator [Pyrinomonadaceae bacterium]